LQPAIEALVMKISIESKQAPAPIGPYSQAIKSGNLVFLSGQIALDPVSGNLILDTLEDETHRVMQNIREVLSAAGCSMDNILKTSIFLSDMNHFARVNAVYGSYFSGAFPARETVQVAGLPRNVNVEISVVAVCNS
jgi:2-iminobutanoate/2-iminopropanoate deaminase